MTSISVVIATYGDPHWLHLGNDVALPSTYLQDGHHLVHRYEREGTRASSLNNAAADATGDWLVFLDADDELAPGYITQMRLAAEQDHAGEVLLTPACQWIRNGIPGPPSYQREVPLETGNWLVIGTMIRRDFFLDLGGFHEHPHGLEDWNLWARAVRAGARILKVPEAVYRAHVNPQSKHRTLFRGDRRGFREAYEKARLDAWG